MTFHQLVLVSSLRTVRRWNKGKLRQLQFLFAASMFGAQETHKIFLALDTSLEERWFYHSALYWVLLVGVLVTSAFLPHEANGDSQ